MYPFNFFNVEEKQIRRDRISDHQPVVENDVLCWNIMMHCKLTPQGRFNNAFELEETAEQYQERLKKIAFMLSFLCSAHPEVQIICLQEAPILPQDKQVFIESCLSYDNLRKFAHALQNSQCFSQWGLVSLFNAEFYQYQTNHHYLPEQSPIDLHLLKDRVQCFTLVQDGGEKRCVVNLHFPFDFTKKFPGKMARMINLIASAQQKESASNFIIAGDFNFLITQFPAIKELGHIFMPEHNSTEILQQNGGMNVLETVDAIISIPGAANGYYTPPRSLLRMSFMK
jgi:hypothetical protein